jgi:hypothetical protein
MALVLRLAKPSRVYRRRHHTNDDVLTRRPSAAEPYDFPVKDHLKLAPDQVEPYFAAFEQKVKNYEHHYELKRDALNKE